MSIIQIKNLTKRYGNITAVDSLNLDIEEGEIFGFLGPNGAGKTTTIKSMTGLIRPTNGDVRIGEYWVSENKRKATVNVGYLPENIKLYDNLTGRETLDFFADVRNVDKNEKDELLAKVDLIEAADRKVGEYSKGMLQRLAFAQSLLGNPSFLILDEPTSGLDPEGTALVKDVVREYAEEEGTVFFSSHILPNVQEVADRVGIITKGELRAIDTVDNLRDKLELPSELSLVISEDVKEILTVLDRTEFIQNFHGKGNKLTVSCESKDKIKVIHLIEEQDVEIIDFTTDHGDLEDIFLKYAGGDV